MLIVRLCGLAILGVSTAIVSLYVFVSKNDVAHYIQDFTKPYGITMNGPVHVSFWPNVHADITSMTTPISPRPLENVTVHIPLIPLVRFAIWHSPISNADINIKKLPLGDMVVDLSAQCSTDGKAVKCKIIAKGKEDLKATFQILSPDFEFKTITITNGEFRQKQNMIQDVQATIHTQNLSNGTFARGSLELEVPGITAPDKLNFELSHSSAGYTLKANTKEISTPDIAVQNIKTVIHQMPKQIKIESLEADVLSGHIQTSGTLTGNQLALVGTGKDIHLEKVKALKEKLKKGLASATWNISFNTSDLPKTLSGSTHVAVGHLEAEGIDLENLKTQVSNFKTPKPEDLEKIKDQFIKPGIIKGEAVANIAWNKGVGTIQKCQVLTSGLETNIAGQVRFTDFQGRAVVTGLKNWPPVGILIKGPFDNLQYQLDWNALMPILLQQAAKQVVKKQGEKLLNQAIGKIIPQSQNGQDSTTKDQLSNALGGLMGKLIK